jgi:Carboxymuconolactone decarboxylase family
MHVKAALRNGLSEAQIQEVLLQVGLYAGVPVANRAFAIAKRVLEAEREGLYPSGNRWRSPRVEGLRLSWGTHQPGPHPASG